MKKTLEEMRIESGLSIMDMLRRSHVSHPTWKKVQDGTKVKPELIKRILNVINEENNNKTSYTLEDVGY